MGNIKILDTGYLRPTNQGTQASSANRANAGSAITLKTVEFIPSLKRNIQDDPEIGLNNTNEVNLGELENMKFQLRCTLNKTSDTDTALIPELIELVATNGYKLMWYDYSDASSEKNNGTLIYRIATNSMFGDQLTAGEATAFGISATFYTLHVHFTNIQQEDRAPSGMISYRLSGVVLKVESSVI